MFRNDIIPAYYAIPKQKNIHVKLVNNGPIVTVTINNKQFPALLDSGSQYTLIPYQFWSDLDMNENNLDQSQIFNISSATHRTRNSCLGTANFNISIPNINKTNQIVIQHSLVLRANMSLSVILLGGDFLKVNNVNLKYNVHQPQPTVHVNNQQIQLASDQISIKNSLVNSFLADVTTTITVDTYISSNDYEPLGHDTPVT